MNKERIDVMRSVKIIKQGKNETLAALQPNEDDNTRRQSTREIMTTVKGWVAEFHRRRRNDELASFEFRKLQMTTRAQISKFAIPSNDRYLSSGHIRSLAERLDESVLIVSAK